MRFFHRPPHSRKPHPLQTRDTRIAAVLVVLMAIGGLVYFVACSPLSPLNR